MSDTLFFRLLDGVNKPSRLSDAIEELRDGSETTDTYRAEPASLRQVPGSPFAYWVSEDTRSKFAYLTRLESHDRAVRLGDHPSDDFRYLRLFWEVPSTSPGLDWRPYKKGGEYSPYYGDVELVADWDESRQTYRGFYGRPGRASVRPSNYQLYFRPGLTYGARVRRFSPHVLPKGVIFSHTSPVIFTDDPALYLGLLNASLFRFFLSFQTAVRKMEVGHVQNFPVPAHLASTEVAPSLRNLSMAALQVRRGFDRGNEISHVFHLPAVLQLKAATLEASLSALAKHTIRSDHQLAAYQQEIDDIVFQLYEVREDRQVIEESLRSGSGLASSLNEDDLVQDVEEAMLGNRTLVANLLSYAVGCVFGRWDLRIALDPSLAPDLADPFAPLPVCSPGMLVGPDALPAQRDSIASEDWMRARPNVIALPPDGSVDNPTIPDSEYPLAVDWDGILVDDPEHDDDIVRRVREVLDLLWGERADAIEGEACDLLAVNDLRVYFRNPKRLFDFHIKRYSKSRRKAPIYWLLQSPKRNYGLWLYYHRLDPDILFKALKNCVEPKVRLEENRLEEYETRRRSAGTAGREARQAERAVKKQEELLADLREFRDRLERAAELYLRPDLNDGVVLNIAPLHELVPWKEAKSKWNDLLSGKYEWSSIGKQLREKGIV
jgi:hypothetical protein